MNKPSRNPRSSRSSAPELSSTYSSSVSKIKAGYAGIKKSMLDVDLVNPTFFPRRKDTMQQLWAARDSLSAIKTYESTASYLLPFKKVHHDSVPTSLPDAAFARSGDFGIIGHGQSDKLRRAYRELKANSMFYPEEPEAPTPIKPTRRNNFKRARSPTELESKWERKSKEYIVLRRDEVAELTAMEKLLRSERKNLQRQCSWLFNDQQMSARVPMPVSKMAVVDVCKAEMREARSLLKVVMRVDESKEGFRERKKKNKKFDTTKGGMSPWDEAEEIGERGRHGEYVGKDTVWPKFKPDMEVLNRTPVSGKAVWYMRQRELHEKELRTFEQSTMLMEETVQRLSWRYIEAKNRMDDYNQYYYYATRYGPYDEEEFNRTPMPGASYHKRCTAGARSWQRMWWAKWPPRRMWLDICATRMQALMRGIWVRKRWRPIVRMRMHHGRYAKMLRCLNPWKTWVAKMKRAKKLLGKILVGALRLNFTSWSAYVKKVKEEREEVARKALKRFIMRREFAVFNSWYSYVERKKKIITMMKRAIGNPAFKHWLDYVDMIKEQKMVLRGFTALQARHRAHVARAEFAGLLKFRHVMKKLVRTKKSLNFMGAVLHALVEEQERKKMDQELKDAVGEEEKRLSEFNAEFDKIESGIRKVKQMQMKTRKGKKEVKELTQYVYEEKMEEHKRGEGPKMTMKEAEEIARARMLNKACDEARLQMKHNFEAKRPPKIQSCDPNNPQVFIYREHYIKACSDFAEIDLCLKSTKGVELFEFYIDRVHGIGAEKFSVNFWQHVATWKKTDSHSEYYRDDAVAIFNDHMDASATQPAAINKSLRERLGTELMKIEIQEDAKDAIEEKKKKGGFGSLFARFQTVEETTLRANIFDEAVWEVIQFLKKNCWEGFLNSNLGEEYREWLKKEKMKARQRRVDQFLQERRQRAREEAKDVKVQLKDMKQVMEEHNRLIMQSQEVFFEVQVEQLVSDAIDEHVKELEAEALAKEKAKYAAINNMSILFMKSLEDNLMEEMIEKCVDDLAEQKLAAMAERKAYEVTRALIEGPFLDQYIEEKFKQQVNVWMKEGGHLSPQEKLEARVATIVQTRARGFLARLKVRRMVAGRFSRQFDEWANNYYWLDSYNQTTSWEQPLKFLWKAVDKSVVKHIAPPTLPPSYDNDGNTLEIDQGGEYYDEGGYDY
ncbi:hypothetical protein TrVE_jg1086 [Triparma verrucosa]|uniref:RGS domain-containing protein n=1 Tax=Triparma verrucosa TaxID=1606542 RepID=A0A9W7CJ70_9STRA|nr:hypothetical protein TrVE_jg1086 [Triparma verrucosa]